MVKCIGTFISSKLDSSINRILVVNINLQLKLYFVKLDDDK